MTSRRKGKRGELEFAQALTDAGFPARRGRQFSGGPDSPDVCCDALAGVHFEVKRCETLRLYAAMEQARTDAHGAMPIVAHRRNGGTWLAVLDLRDVLALLRLSRGNAP